MAHAFDGRLSLGIPIESSLLSPAETLPFVTELPCSCCSHLSTCKAIPSDRSAPPYLADRILHPLRVDAGARQLACPFKRACGEPFLQGRSAGRADQRTGGTRSLLGPA